jgi:hypothetical protein
MLMAHPSPPCRYHLHRALNVVGLALATGSFVLALVKFNLNDEHRTYGIVTMVLGFLQPINALVRPPRGEPDVKKTVLRSVWEQSHHWTGRAALVMAALTVWTGIDAGVQYGVYTSTRKWKAAFVILMVGLAVLWALLFAVHWFLWRRRAVPAQDLTYQTELSEAASTSAHGRRGGK